MRTNPIRNTPPDWPFEPQEDDPLPPQDAMTDEEPNPPDFDERWEPPIVNRDALRLSQTPLPFDVSTLFWAIQDALDQTDPDDGIEARLYYENIAHQIFSERIEELQFLHSTPLSRIRIAFGEQSNTYGTDDDLQEKISRVLSSIFFFSICNSSIRKLAEDLDTSIERHLFQTTLAHFQQVIKQANTALRRSSSQENIHEALQELTKASLRIESLNNLYAYIEGSETELMKQLIFQCSTDEGLMQFPNAYRHYQSFTNNLNARKLDSPLRDLKRRLNDEISRLMQRRPVLTERSIQSKFCDIEAEVIWSAGLEILHIAYENKNPHKDRPSDQRVYEKWSEYCKNPPMDCKEIIEKFINQLNVTAFRNLSARMQALHSTDDSQTEELKEARKKILIDLFVAQFRNPPKFKDLKKWFEK